MDSSAERLVNFLNNNGCSGLLDCFIIDFFTERHWEKLHQSWRSAFEGCSFEEAHSFLLPQAHGSKEQRQKRTVVWPLSLLAYVATARSLSLPRSQQDYKPCSSPDVHGKRKPHPKKHVSSEEVGQGVCPEWGLKLGSDVAPSPHLLTRHVKPKKRHELHYLKQTVAALARQTETSLVVDVGSGQGHLSRCLAFEHGLDVISVEAEGCHQDRAARFAKQAAHGMRKEACKAPAVEQSSLLSENKGDYAQLKCGRLQHVTAVLHAGTTAEDFMKEVLKGKKEVHPACAGQAAEQSCVHVERDCLCPITSAPPAGSSGPQSGDDHVLVGLHTCGDLGPTMLRVFATCPHARGLVSVGCCYMKMTTAENQLQPMAPLPPPSTSSGKVPSQPLVHGEVPSQPLVPKEVPSQSLIPGEVPSQPLVHGEVPSQPLVHGEVRSQPTLLEEVVHSPPHVSSEIASRPPVLEQALSPPPLPRELPPPLPPAGQLLGYPMSQFVSSLAGHELSYRAREVSCHAIESLALRLLNDPEHLKVHCHRAVMETILTQHGMHRVQVRLSSKQSKLPFAGYAEAVLNAVNLKVDLRMEELQPMLAQWWKVALFFLVRLVMAPCVESLILLDRAHFLKERGACVGLVPLFEPSQSPRNIAILAHKSKICCNHNTLQ